MIKYMLLVLLLPISVSAESYLCIAELSAGFIYEENTKEWGAVTGKGGDKFVVSEPVEDDLFYRQAKWKVTKHGEKSAFTFCEEGFNDTGFLECEGYGVARFIMNKDTLRFKRIYNSGYVVSSKAISEGWEGDDEPHIRTGKSSEL